jgi:lipid-A-disaccharide synthase
MLGQEQFVDGRRLAVLGFWEVARHFLFFRKLMSQCVREVERRRPSAIVLVDYPGFNLRLAERVKHLGIPIIYYISPQVWAWGGQRLEQIHRLVDLMLPILPFEKNVFDNSGVNNQYVGHYLLEDIPEKYISSKVPTDGHLAVLPGSRPQEIERHLRPMLETAEMLHRQHGLATVVAAVRGVYDYESALREFSGTDVTVVYDDPRGVVYDASLALVASGTATLETAIIGRPMVVMYKTGWITYQIARRLVKLNHIALANLVLGKRVVPELIQHQATPKMMAAELERYLDDQPYRESTISDLHRTPAILGGRGASARAAQAIMDLIDSRSGGAV